MRINKLVPPVKKSVQPLREIDTLAYKFPRMCEEWHPEKNACRPEDIRWDCHQRAWWLCKKCGTAYETEIDSHIAGIGCPVCSGHQITAGINSLADTNPALAAEYDEKKNCRPVTAVSEKQAIVVWWKCRNCGHEWQAAITGRAQGRDCPKCSR